jgi:hypothetical protein
MVTFSKFHRKAAAALPAAAPGEILLLLDCHLKSYGGNSESRQNTGCNHPWGTGTIAVNQQPRNQR